MIRQDYCPKCQQITSQKTVTMFTVTVTTCQQCSTTLKFEYPPRKIFQAVKARKSINRVSPKQAKRNRELAKIEPPPDGKCQNCGKSPDFRGLAKHHKTFRSHGGKDTLDNIEWLCGRCHSLRHYIHEK